MVSIIDQLLKRSCTLISIANVRLLLRDQFSDKWCLIARKYAEYARLFCNNFNQSDCVKNCHAFLIFDWHSARTASQQDWYLLGEHAKNALLAMHE